MIPLNPQKVLTGGVMFLCIVILGTRVNFLRFKRKSEKSVTKINDDLMIAIGEASVRGRRPTLEDEILIDLDICQNDIHLDIDQTPRLTAFGVLDGHCGIEVAAIGRLLIGRYIAAHQECFSKQPEVAAAGITRAMVDLDLTTQLRQGGSTVNFTIINSNGYLMNVNAGDSRAVLIRDFKAIPLSFDHKPSRESEKKRIEKIGGVVHPTQLIRSGCVLSIGPERIWPGGLSVSRGLGDWHLKNLDKVKNLIIEQGLTFDPFKILYKETGKKQQENQVNSSDIKNNKDIIVEDEHITEENDKNETPLQSFSVSESTKFSLEEGAKLKETDPDVEQYITTNEMKSKIPIDKDAELKNAMISQLVCSVPEIHHIELDESCQLVVCGCDGLFDVVSNADIARIAQENLNRFMGHAIEQVAIRNIEQCLPQNDDGDINGPNVIGKGVGKLSKVVARLKFSMFHQINDYRLPEPLLQQADYICAQMLAQKYVDLAIQRQSSDNISCVVCIFRWRNSPQTVQEWEAEPLEGSVFRNIRKIFQKRQKTEYTGDYEEREIKAVRIVSQIDPSKEWL